jgi:hypothetical protein
MMQEDPVFCKEGWVIDGSYQSKLGTRILDLADVVIWLDLPMHVWLLRLIFRTARRMTGNEPLWNGNRENWRGVIGSRNSLFIFAIRSHFKRRRGWPRYLANYRVVRLRSTHAVGMWLTSQRSQIG